MAIRRWLGGAAAILAAWTGALLVLDRVLEGREARSVGQRVGESLQAKASVGATDLALVRGRLRLDDLAVRRDDIVGHLAIDVREIRCELAPLGWALVDRDCGELAVRGTRLEVSTAALFQVPHPQRRPIRADHVVIDDAVLAFAPSAFAPDLGRIAITIDHAEAGPTVFRTPLSWLFALTVLRARIELPAGITLRLTYQDGVLSAAGSLFGSTPVALPVTLPLAEAAHDAHDEIQLLVKTGTDLAERLVAKRAQDWIESKLR